MINHLMLDHLIDDRTYNARSSDDQTSNARTSAARRSGAVGYGVDLSSGTASSATMLAAPKDKVSVWGALRMLVFHSSLAVRVEGHVALQYIA
jgi:hypothetical protein